MELLSTVMAAIGGFFAGFVGHVTAHDFCEAVPRWSKKLIAKAASRLSPRDRERYEEEWLADLADRPTTMSKLYHAVGCFSCASKMRGQSVPPEAEVTVRFEFVGNGFIEVDGYSTILFGDLLNTTTTFMHLRRSLPRLAQRPFTRITRPIFRGVTRYQLWRAERAHIVDRQSVARMIDLVFDENTKGFRAYVDGELATSSETEGPNS